MKRRFPIVFAFALGFGFGIALYDTQQQKADAKRRQEFAAEVDKCGRLYPVTDRNMKVRCAQLVPGIAWQLYRNAEEEEANRQAALKRLARKQ